MRDMILAGHRARMIQLAAELGLADLLAAAPRTSCELAAMTGTDSDALFRLMRALASQGLFARDGDGEDAPWRLAPLGETLRSDATVSCRPMALYWGLDCLRAAWDHLDYSVRTAQPGFQHANGAAFFDHMAKHSDDGAVFDAFIAQPLRYAIHAAAIDWSGFAHVVDVGGGGGGFLREVLVRNPHLVGTVFDTERVIGAMHGAGDALASRLRTDAGSFFERITSGADAYVLSQVLHDWPDPSCLAILRACRAAMLPHGTLFVMEQVIGDGPDPAFTDHLDMVMLVLLGGRERSRAEFDRLFAVAGFALESVTPMATSFCLLTCRAL